LSFHRPLLSGYDEPETLFYQIAPFGPIGADVRQKAGAFFKMSRSSVTRTSSHLSRLTSTASSATSSGFENRFIQA
jgi:hypothetical protein